MERHTPASIYELLHHERYHIICLHREDVVAWFAARQEQRATPR
jgi:hypothetical protein